MTGEYEDIIHLPHHVSSKRPQMSMLDRAAQFSPFAALTGYDDAIQETGRLTEQKIELDEETLEKLDERFQILQEHLGEQPEVRFTYFKPDERKEGGAYLTVSGVVRKIKLYEREILLQDGTIIPVDDILKMESSIFPQIDIACVKYCSQKGFL